VSASVSARPKPAYRLAALTTRPFLRLLFRVRVSGVENVPDGGLVLAANHLSGWDVVALAYPLPSRWLRHMAKPQLFRRRFLGPLVRFLGAFPSRGGAGSSVDVAAGLARAGHAVVIMPEGARRRSDRMHQPHTGAARAALAAGVPLVPAALRGTDQVRHLGRWEIAFGPPIPLDDLDAGGADAAGIATERLWDAIRELEAGLGQPAAAAFASRSKAT
jgi:1-acyl-sn-glycerol-3-phosphate acyltransferase